MVKHGFFDWSHWFGLRNLSRPHRDLTGIDRIWGIIPIFPFLRSVNCHNLPSGNLQDKMSVMKTTFMVILKYENILDFITYFLGGVYTYIYIFIKCKTLCHILLWILVIYFGVLDMYWIFFIMADDGLSLFLMGIQPTTVYCVNTWHGISVAHGRDYEIFCNLYIYIYLGIFDWDILWDTYIRDYGISSCGYCISTGYLTGDFWGRTPMMWIFYDDLAWWLGYL